MTFNVLCPEYKRASNGGASGRESEDMAAAEARAEATLAEIASLDADVVCVQEFWHASEGIASLWRERLRECGYEAMHVTRRTSGRCDGLLTATKRDVEVLDARDVLFNDCGDRVATAVRLKKAGVEMIVVNTHLLFPHNENSSLIRLRESFKILGFLHEMFNEPTLRGRRLPIVITGDFNGTNNGRVFRFLTSQGFVSALDSTIDAAKRKAWVSHKNHHGELVGVDHMFLLNPSSQITPIGVSWKDAVFAMVRAKIVEKGLVDDVSAFAAFDENGDGTLSRDEFAEFANNIGLCGEKSPGLLPAELEALYESLDKDGNGLVDFGEFVERMDIKGMAACLADPSDSMDISDYMSCSASDRVILPLTESWDQDMWDDGDLRIERASLPDVMIRGEWPDDYCSDHGPLTATFSLRKF
jgi:endonuclease/exonuclease/phosphatase family metal-dependent hydrolase